MQARPTRYFKLLKILCIFKLIYPLLNPRSHWHIKCLQFLYQNFSHYSFSKCIARIPMAYYTYFCMIFENSHITYFDPWECVTAHHFHKKYSDNFLCIFFLFSIKKCFIFVSWVLGIWELGNPQPFTYHYHYFHP